MRNVALSISLLYQVIGIRTLLRSSLNLFHTLRLRNNFFEKRKPFWKNCSTKLLLKLLRMKTQDFHTNLVSQKPMLIQTEWWVQNGPVIWTEFCQQLLHFFENLVLVLETLIKSWYVDYPRIHINTFCKRWTFIWGCCFPVSILKLRLLRRKGVFKRGKLRLGYFIWILMDSG